MACQIQEAVELIRNSDLKVLKVRMESIIENNSTKPYTLKESITSVTGVEILAKNVKGEIQLSKNKKLWSDAFTDKAWTNPRKLSDGTKAAALPSSVFSTQQELMQFVFLHENAYNYIKINDNESRGSYETRINNEALRMLKKELIEPSDTLGSEQLAKSKEDILLRKMGGKVDISLNNERNFKSLPIKSIKFLNNDKEVYLTTAKGSYTFKVGVGGYKSNTANTGTIAYAKWLNILAAQTLDEVESSTVFSEGTQKLDTNEANLRENAFSKEGMLSIVDELSKDNDLSTEYIDLVKGLINSIDTKYLPELKLYLDKNTGKNRGALQDNNVVVETSKADMGLQNSKSGLEVYAHEMMHAITKFAIDNGKFNPKVVHLVNQLEFLRREATKHITSEMLVPKDTNFPKEELAHAKKLLDYAFKGKNGLHEFIAHALTNPAVMEQLKKLKVQEKKVDVSLWERIKEVAMSLLSMVFGTSNMKNQGKSFDVAARQLVFELMQYNNEAQVAIDHTRTVGEKVANFLDIVGNKPLSELLTKMSDKFEESDIERPPKNGSKVDYAKWLTKYLPQLMFQTKMRPIREQVMFVLGADPEGVLNNIIRDFQDPDVLERVIEQLGLNSSQVDRRRMITTLSVEAVVSENFKRKLSKFEKEALTYTIVDMDLSTVYDDYSVESMKDMLSDTKKITAEIANLETSLAKIDSKNSDFYKAQTTGLGTYLVDGKAGIAQFLNATNIANEVGKRSNTKIVNLIDKIATLKGLKEANKATKDTLVSMINESPEGIKHIVDLQRSIQEDSARIFSNETNMIKGYSRETFDDTIDLKIKPIKDREKMEKEGYTLKETLKKNPYDNSAPEMGIYVSKMYITNKYNIHAVRITGENKRGTSLSDIANMSDETLSRRIAKRDIAKLRVERLKVLEAMKDGTYEQSENDSLSPVMNESGDVVDFRYMMSKWQKKTLLNQDTSVLEVMGKTIASVQDKISTKLQNEATLEVVLGDMKTNYIPGFTVGKNGHQYFRVEKNSDNAKVAELYKILPRNFIEAIDNTEEGYIAVRRDMFHMYFGFRDPSILDFFSLYKITPEVIQKYIRLAEKVWQEVVRISKVDIVIRTPAVFIGNFISNMMYSVINGASPFRVLKMQLQHFRSIKRYLEIESEIERLKLDKRLGKKVDSRISALETEKKRMGTVHTLMEAGMYQAIVEDLDKQDFKSNSKFAQAINDKMEGMPGWLKEGAQQIYVSEQTSIFKAMTQATQYSDFVARATEYDLAIERGASSEDAKKKILDAFVNYTKPASSLEEYMNNMGLFMFTKYAKRIQRAVKDGVKTKPLNVILAMFGQEMFWDIDDIYDQNLLTRSYTNLDQDWFEHVKRAVIPSGAEAVYSLIK